MSKLSPKDQSQPIQDLYPDQVANCFGCGRNSSDGYHLQSFVSDDATEVTAHYRPDAKYSGGIKDSMYGGLLASLIDCHSAATASFFKMVSLGLPADSPAPRFVTASLTVDFKHPTPAGAELELHAWAESISDRKVCVNCEVHAAGVVTVTGHTLMIMVKE